MILALRLALRDLRGGTRGLRVVMACLALGVAAIATVGSLRAAVARGIAANGATLLGGDIAVRARDPLPDALRTWLTERGARVSGVIAMQSMAVAPGGKRLLVELKAADDAWPLLGQAVFDPAQSVQSALGRRDGRWGMAVDPLVLARLGLHPGDTVRLGAARFTIRGTVAAEPDRASTPAWLGPRALIAAAALPDTGLIVPGAMVHYVLRAVLPAGRDPAAVLKAIRAHFGDRGWNLQTAHDALPGLMRFVDEVSVFMALAGLASLLVGGVGVANGVRAWLQARAGTIATLRCLGASARLVFTVVLIQVGLLSGIGVLAGLIGGAAIPAGIIVLLRHALPVPPHLGVYPGALGIAAAYGVLIAGCFALWPLGRGMRIPGGALLREGLLVAPGRPAAWLIAANALIAAVLVALAVLASADRLFAAKFCAAAAASLLALRAGAWLLVRVAALLARHAPLDAPSRLGLANLRRPGGQAPLLFVSLGIGLATLAAIALIEGNMQRALEQDLPAHAPSFYFIGIQNDDLAQFQRIVHAQAGVESVRQMPILRARIVAVNGVPAAQVKAAPGTEWALRGDRGLTYDATPPPGTHLVDGQWWRADYRGPPLVSLDATLARGWGVTLGGTITVSVLGRDIALRVTSLRDVAWRSLSLNFVLIASPGLLEGAPHAHIATVRVRPDREAAVLAAVTDAMPNVTGIAVRPVLSSIAGLARRIGAALAATGLVALAAGMLVLAGALAAGQRRRIADAVILKTLGATRAQLRRAWLVEFGLLGAGAGIAAAAIGTAASYAVMRRVLHGDWAFLGWRLAAVELGSVALMLLAGWSGLAGASRARAAPLLRNE